MTKKIILIQHGEPKGDRGLTANGAKAMNALAERLHEADLAPQMVLRGVSWPEVESAQSLTQTFGRLGSSVKAKECGDVFDSLKGAKKSVSVIAVVVCAERFAELLTHSKASLPADATVAIAEVGDAPWAETFARSRFPTPFQAF